jgi:hypothetical protein
LEELKVEISLSKIFLPFDSLDSSVPVDFGVAEVVSAGLTVSVVVLLGVVAEELLFGTEVVEDLLVLLFFQFI